MSNEKQGLRSTKVILREQMESAIIGTATSQDMVNHIHDWTENRLKSANRKKFQLALYDDSDLIQKSFYVHDDPSGMSHLLWLDTNEEVVLEVSGMLAECSLRPTFLPRGKFNKFFKMDEEQMIGIVGPGVPGFMKALDALQHIYEFMANCYGTGIVFGYAERSYETLREIQPSTRFLTPINQLWSPSATIPDYLDERGGLKNMVSSGKARYTEDNIVLYHVMNWESPSEAIKVPVGPDKFRAGQVIQATINFRLLQAGHRRKFLLGLDGIMLQNSTGVAMIGKANREMHARFMTKPIIRKRRGDEDFPDATTSKKSKAMDEDQL